MSLFFNYRKWKCIEGATIKRALITVFTFSFLYFCCWHGEEVRLLLFKYQSVPQFSIKNTKTNPFFFCLSPRDNVRIVTWILLNSSFKNKLHKFWVNFTAWLGNSSGLYIKQINSKYLTLFVCDFLSTKKIK